MEGSAKIISFIARDEAQHLAVSQHILKAYKNHENDKLMNKVMKDCEQEVYAMYEDAVAQEKEWAEFLFRDDLNDWVICFFIGAICRIHSKQKTESNWSKYNL